MGWPVVGWCQIWGNRFIKMNKNNNNNNSSFSFRIHMFSLVFLFLYLCYSTSISSSAPSLSSIQFIHSFIRSFVSSFRSSFLLRSFLTRSYTYHHSSLLVSLSLPASQSVFLRFSSVQYIQFNFVQYNVQFGVYVDDCVKDIA